MGQPRPVPLWLRVLMICGALLILLPLIGLIEDRSLAGAMRVAGLLLCCLGAVIVVVRSRRARQD